jgi:hypothetical protein
MPGQIGKFSYLEEADGRVLETCYSRTGVRLATISDAATVQVDIVLL